MRGAPREISLPLVPMIRRSESQDLTLSLVRHLVRFIFQRMRSITDTLFKLSGFNRAIQLGFLDKYLSKLWLCFIEENNLDAHWGFCISWWFVCMLRSLQPFNTSCVPQSGVSNPPSQRWVLHIPHPISAKIINVPPMFALFRFLGFVGFPPTLTMMHLRIMLNMCWMPLASIAFVWLSL